MEKLIVLGTGSGLTINCYSLSALLENTNGNYLLIDTGSGNQILNHLKAKNININKIHDIFISHKHIDRSFFFAFHTAKSTVMVLILVHIWFLFLVFSILLVQNLLQIHLL